MHINSMFITESGEKLPDSLDVVSEKIIVFGLKKAGGITYDGTFVLQEQLTMIDTEGEIVTPQKWVKLVDEQITYKDKSYKVLNQSDPELEQVVRSILEKSIENKNNMMDRGIN